MIKNYLSIIKRRGLIVLLMCRSSIILSAFMLLRSTEFNAQGSPKDLIEDQFNSYRENNLQEKIFVHTDKNNYVPGEICWFKIYNVDAYFHRPLNLGKLAYVEILDKNNKAVLTAKIALDKGSGDGSLYLPATIISGNYRLRAYTNWMKNYSADYFFEKKLSIINVQRNQPENILSQKTSYDIGVFPEGGNLVNGIKCKVGFRIINQWGKGVDCDGVLLNEKDDIVTSFRPVRFGIGSFTFTPVAGSTYRASVKLPNGDKQVKELPPAYNTGYAMHMEKSRSGKIKITVQTTDASISSTPAIFLFVHTRNVTKGVISNTIRNGQAEFLIEDTSCGDGISHFTIFDKNRQPVCERLFYKRPLRTLRITATALQPVYKLREKITIDINSVTEAGKHIPANMSMAVFRIDSLNSIDEQGIDNYLMLSADLSGTVESPDYYFSQNNEAVETALDNLMLTQGWRRFRWEEILSNKKVAFQFLPEINGHIINAKITALQPGLGCKTYTYLSVPGMRTQFSTARSGEDGKIKFEMKNFYSDGDIVLQTDNEKDSLYRFDIEPPFFTRYSRNMLAPFDVTGRNDALLKRYIASQVQNAFLYNRLNQSSVTQFDTAAFYLKADAAYYLDNYVRFTTLEEVLREYVMEVNVRQRNGKFYLPVYDEGGNTVFDTNPLVLLDGVPIFNFNTLLKYDPLMIRKMEIVNRTYYLGGNSFDGIVNLVTYGGKMEGHDVDPRATIMDYEGLQLKRDFYSPIYETTEQTLSRIPDFRSLLQWSPTIKTIGSDKVQTRFYSSDLPGRYAIVIQGLGEDGRVGTSVSYFEVKK